MKFNIDIFPALSKEEPKIYAYQDSEYPGFIKVGFTTRKVEDRIREQYGVIRPEKTYKVLWFDSAMRNDGTTFIDKDLHKVLKAEKFENKGEWFRCSLSDVKNAYLCVKERRKFEQQRFLDFKMRPEQVEAVNKTLEYFKKIDGEGKENPPHFLWNAKMRFGKTFTTYELAKAMNAKRVLVLTFKPAVEQAWHDDLMYHKDFEGWQFFPSENVDNPNQLDREKPIVCFGSFQDYLGKNSSGGIKAKNEWVHTTPWDLIVLDEYHFGAWDDRAQSLIESGDDESKAAINEENEILREDGYDVSLGKRVDESIMPITGSHYLYLSGTPFKALASGDFLEDQIFNWTYQDEQQAKASWQGPNNPYEDLPAMVFMTYQMPNNLGNLIDQYNMDEFDLNEFFKADGIGGTARFVHERAVQKWLDILRGKATIFDSTSPDNKVPPLPYDDERLLNLCKNTMWFMNSVSSCDAMENLLNLPVNTFYHDYKIINCSGTKAGIGIKALTPVENAYGNNPVDSKTILLTCGKLTTGVTLRPLSGILMLRNCSSPETYFQASFRVQSPWAIDDPDLKKKIILKKTCYVFDFAPNRALREIVDYSNKLNVDSNESPEQKVDDFISFLPVLQFDGSGMHRMDASSIVDFVDHGTTATLLARRWNTPTLVNVDNATLTRVMRNPNAMAAIMKIEGFRALGSDIIETIVNKQEKIKSLKRKDRLSPGEKKELTDSEKEFRSKRKLVQQKLMKFATRIPIFMYLTDYREEALKDIIRKIEPNLFTRVTGLTIDDFETLVSLGVFNDVKMNEGILGFRRYEDKSLSYTGINKHENDERVGAWDTSVSKEDIDTIVKK